MYVPYVNDIVNKTLIELPNTTLSELKLTLHKMKRGNNITYVILTVIVIILILLIMFQYYKKHDIISQDIREDANDLEGGRSSIRNLFP